MQLQYFPSPNAFRWSNPPSGKETKPAKLPTFFTSWDSLFAYCNEGSYYLLFHLESRILYCDLKTKRHLYLDESDDVPPAEFSDKFDPLPFSQIIFWVNLQVLLKHAFNNFSKTQNEHLIDFLLIWNQWHPPFLLNLCNQGSTILSQLIQIQKTYYKIKVSNTLSNIWAESEMQKKTFPKGVVGRDDTHRTEPSHLWTELWRCSDTMKKLTELIRTIRTQQNHKKPLLRQNLGPRGAGNGCSEQKMARNHTMDRKQAMGSCFTSRHALYNKWVTPTCNQPAAGGSQ